MNSKAYITLTPGIHRQKEVILIQFNYSKKIYSKIKTNPKAQWSYTRKCWYIPRKDFDLHNFFESFKGMAYIDYSAVKKQNKLGETGTKQKHKKPQKEILPLPPGYLEKLRQKRYSQHTIKTYCHYFRDFQEAFKDKDIETLDPSEINAYLLKLVQKKNISQSQQNQRINAIKFYYEKVLGREKTYYSIDRPRRERKLPDVLSKEEVGAMLRATKNPKHKCILALIYSCGLRRGELINLRLEDVDSKRMLIKIRGAKGKKDRYVQLPSVILPLLRNYYKEIKPKKWLFEGQKGGQYSPTSVLRLVKHSASLAGIKKRVYPHILRHSYATHLTRRIYIKN